MMRSKEMPKILYCLQHTLMVKGHSQAFDNEGVKRKGRTVEIHSQKQKQRTKSKVASTYTTAES